MSKVMQEGEKMDFFFSSFSVQVDGVRVEKAPSELNAKRVRQRKERLQWDIGPVIVLRT